MQCFTAPFGVDCFQLFRDPLKRYTVTHRPFQPLLALLRVRSGQFVGLITAEYQGSQRAMGRIGLDQLLVP